MFLEAAVTDLVVSLDGMFIYSGFLMCLNYYVHE